MSVRFQILYDFGDQSGVTGWLLLKDGIVASTHGSWAEAAHRMAYLVKGEGK